MRRPSFPATCRTLLVAASLSACGSGGTSPTPVDAGREASGHPDAGHPDAAKPVRDAAVHDAIRGAPDARERDATSAHDAARAVDASDAAFLDIGPDGGWIIAPHDPAPAVVDYGGTVLASPVFTAITFPAFDLTTEAQALVSELGGTAYWTSALGEYGVGAATATAPIVLTEAAPTSIDDPTIQTWLASNLGANPPFGAPTASSVYVVFYPSSTAVTLLGAPVCQHFGGYHNTVTLGSGPYSGTTVAYVVIAECASGQAEAISLSETVAHELTAVATDPYPLAAPAYDSVAPADEVWTLVTGGGGEVPDLCSTFADSYFVPTGLPYTVGRVWSNLNAAASHDPCQPSPTGEVYFNAAPHQPDSVTLTVQSSVYQVHGVLTPLNVPKTIEVDLFSDGLTPAWTVAAGDLSATLGGGPYLKFSWDATTGQNGTKLHLTVTPLQQDTYGGELFEITSTNGTTTRRWYGAVGQQ